jgi:hypothetical protein
MKEEVGSESSRWRRANAILVVAKEQRGRSGSAVGIANIDGDGDRRLAVEEHVGLASKSQVLGPLPYIEPDLRFALS